MEKFIVRQNLARASEGKEFDVKYLLTDLGLEGFNEILTQIRGGNLDKEILGKEYMRNLMNAEFDDVGEINFYLFEQKIQAYKKINESRWQSWNLEYEEYKRNVEILNGSEYCLSKKQDCDLLV